ncbi:hypothetical protein CTI12_AA064010 [Artemisia annua]|uniref:RNA-directed DNA polymerase, eukaryota, Reverse transcriptase zinc-binding domain protein n=1 Tax=Artemisia annua TaxID=35608 RepID=A0A2U1Q7S6_ARTAN|nr:hypothetical protein CTI12_AA064010 [Artemisia annua]
MHTLRHKVGNGSSIRFWKDNWIGNRLLSSRYNRLFHLDVDANCLLYDRLSNGIWSWNWSRQNLGSRNEEALENLLSEVTHVSVNSSLDTWQWSIAHDDVFSVLDTCIHVDNAILPSLCPSTRWSKILPRKKLLLFHVNIFIWRLIRVWINVNMPTFHSCFDWLQWFEDWKASRVAKDRVYCISSAVLWSNFVKKSDLFDFIRMISFSWFKHRGHKDLCWNSWLNNHL